MLAVASVEVADTATGSRRMQYDQSKSVDSGEYYKANRLSINRFGTASVGKYTI